METSSQKKLWFRAKRYGWGWYPVTWQGWLSIVVYLVLIVPMPFILFRDTPQGVNPPPQTIAILLLWYAFVTGVLLTVCFKRGERPRWRWGGKDRGY